MKNTNRLLVVLFLACVAVAKEMPQNEKLLAAVEPFEGLTETALSGNGGKIDSAFKEIDKSKAATRALLPGENAARYDQLFVALQAAHTKHDNIAVALQGAELYKLIVSSLNSATLMVPMEVSLLDYSGFRTNALLKAPASNWAAITATAQEANAYWARIRDRVLDKKLQAGMEKAQQGLAAAAKAHNAALSASSAKSNLDLVDELESYFARTGKTGKK